MLPRDFLSRYYKSGVFQGAGIGHGLLSGMRSVVHTVTPILLNDLDQPKKSKTLQKPRKQRKPKQPKGSGQERNKSQKNEKKYHSKKRQRSKDTLF
jgi:hypothetical protein